MISFYILSKTCFLKRKRLSDAKVVSITKNEYGFAVFFCKKSSSLESQYYMQFLEGLICLE